MDRSKRPSLNAADPQSSHSPLPMDVLPALVPEEVSAPLPDESQRTSAAAALVEQLHGLSGEVRRQGDLENAEALLRHALRVDRRHVPARHLLAQILIDRGQLEEALVELEQVHTRDPLRARGDLARALVGCGERREQAGDDELALGAYERALGLEGAEGGTAREHIRVLWLRRGERALKEGNETAALVAFEKADARERSEELAALRRQRAMEQAEADALRHEGLGQWEEAQARYAWLEEQANAEDRFRSGRERAETEIALRLKYDEGVAALKDGDRTSSLRSLAEVVARRPDYRDAAELLSRAATGKAPAPPQVAPSPAPAALDINLDDTAPAPPTGPTASQALSLLLVGAMAGGAATFLLHKPKTPPPVQVPVPVPAQPSPETRAAVALLSAEREIGQRNWDQAAVLADNAAAVAGIDSVTRQVALRRKELAEREKQAEQILLKFLYRAGAGEAPEKIVALYQSIPASSVYRDVGADAYRQAVAGMVRSYLKLADGARGGGHCWEFRYYLSELRQVAPTDPQLRALTEKRCTDKGRSAPVAPTP